MRQSETLARSRLVQQQINNPTTANVFAGLTTVFQHVGVVATGFFEGIGQDGEFIKSSLIVNLLSYRNDASVVP